MILYSDEYTRKLELEGKWIDCVRYSHEKLTADRKNVSLFLKLSVNTWYTLTLDGPVLSLKKSVYDTLTDMLCHCFKYFNSAFSANENCQWLFGYMMEVRPDLFLNSGVEYTAIEQQGKIQIEKQAKMGTCLHNYYLRWITVLIKKLKGNGKESENIYQNILMKVRRWISISLKY